MDPFFGDFSDEEDFFDPGPHRRQAQRPRRQLPQVSFRHNFTFMVTEKYDGEYDLCTVFCLVKKSGLWFQMKGLPLSLNAPITLE
jgi:hypothetical protein